MDKDMFNRGARPGTNVVRVTLPAEIAFDLDRFQTVQKDILGRLGCPGCCSGWDIRFDIERHFVIDANLKVRSATAFE